MHLSITIFEGIRLSQIANECKWLAILFGQSVFIWEGHEEGASGKGSPMTSAISTLSHDFVVKYVDLKINIMVHIYPTTIFQHDM